MNKILAFAALTCVAAFAGENDGFYLPEKVTPTDVGAVAFTIDEVTYGAGIGDDGTVILTDNLSALIEKNKKNAAFNVAWNALQKALTAEIETKLLAKYVDGMMSGDGFYAEYTDIDGIKRVATVKYYDQQSERGTPPPSGVVKSTLEVGKVKVDDKSIAKAADGTLSVNGWNTNTGEDYSIADVLADRLENDPGFKNLEVMVREPTYKGAPGFIKIGNGLGHKPPDTDGESITTNEVAGGKLSIVGFEAAKGAADGVPQIPYTSGDSIEWGSTEDFSDLQSVSVNDDGKLEVYGFAGSEPGSIAVAGDEHVEWKGMGDLANSELFGTDGDGKLIIKDYNGSMGQNLYVGTDEEGTFGWWSLPEFGLVVDGESVTTNEADNGGISIKGFKSAKTSTVAKFPHAVNNALGWSTLDSFFSMGQFGTGDDGKIDLWGYFPASVMQIPYKGEDGLEWADFADFTDGELFSVDDEGALILAGWSSSTSASTYFGKDADGVVGFHALPERLRVDGQSITTNSADGAVADGEASLANWSTAKAAASSTDPRIPYTAGGDLGWEGLDSFVDGETIVKDSNASAIKLNGWTSGMGSRHYYGTDTDGNGPGFYELPNVTTNTVEADEITITTDTSEDGNTKKILLKGSKEAKEAFENNVPQVPYITATEFAWKGFGAFFDERMFASTTGGSTTLKGAETGVPDSGKYFGTDSSGNVGFHGVLAADEESITESDGKLKIKWPSGDGAFVATAGGWNALQVGAGGYPPDGKSLDLDSSGSTTNLQIKGWKTATACQESAYGLLTQTETDTQHLILAKVGEDLHYLPFGTDKLPLPDGETLEKTDDTPAKVRIKAGTDGQWLKTASGNATWSDLPTISAADGSSISVVKDTDGNYTIGGGGSGAGITVEGDANSASGTVFKVTSADDSAVKVDVSKSGDTVTIKIGVYYQ